MQVHFDLQKVKFIKLFCKCCVFSGNRILQIKLILLEFYFVDGNYCRSAVNCTKIQNFNIFQCKIYNFEFLKFGPFAKINFPVKLTCFTIIYPSVL